MRTARPLIATLAVGLAVFLLGPTVPIDTTVHDLVLPPDLDRYLTESEASVPGIRPGTEKLILWANAAERSRTPLSLVYLHGFSATRQETRPLSEQIAHRLGANLFYTRLTGHGRDGAALARASVNDWLNDAVEALEIGRQLGDRVVVIGSSTGATLATWLATTQQTPDLTAVVLLSPNFGVQDGRAQILTLPWARRLAPLIAGPEHGFEPANARHERYWTTRYPTTALLPMMGLVELVRRSPLEQIELPVLILYSTHDTIIDLATLGAIHARLGSRHKPLIDIGGVEDPQRHVLAGDILSPGTTGPVSDHIIEFLRQIGAVAIP